MVIVTITMLATKELHFEVKEVTKVCFAFATITARLRSIAVFRVGYFSLKGWYFKQVVQKAKNFKIIIIIAIMSIIGVKVSYYS